ncbi:MAG TPA: tetratricopeptide repeat protein, partial [Ktedonobacteraceae bacterium]
TTLKHLEEQMQYSNLKERLQDDEWVGIYLDLTEQQYWFDPVEGVRHILPFMIASAIYRRDINVDALAIGQFFEQQVRQPYRDWWTWAIQSLVYSTNRNPSTEELTGLEKLAKLAEERCPPFPIVLPDFRNELEAALWWRMGESHRGRDDYKAMEWFERALSRLDKEIELREAAAEACYEVGKGLGQERKYTESIRFLNRAIELNSDYTWAYIVRGLTYYEDLKEYQRAIADYNRAIELDPSNAAGYNNRGLVYDNLKQYDQAIADYDRSIELEPFRVGAYYNRGIAYRDLKEYQRAIADYNRAIELDHTYVQAYYSRGYAYLLLKNVPQAKNNYTQSYELDATNMHAAWMAEWVGMSKRRPGMEKVMRLEAIVAINPEHYVAYVCRGVALGIGGNVKEGMEEVKKAIPLDPQKWDAYFWKGMLIAYYYRGLHHAQEAMDMIERSLAAGLPPVLLTPLYWLEKDIPNLFVQYARPLLLRYDV